MIVKEFSPDQAQALDKILDWKHGHRHASQQYMTMGGYAGTGKTTIVSHLTESWGGAAVGALCGKAAHVLRSKGVDRAQTVHSMIYVPFENDEGKVRFRKREKLDPSIRSIIVDEASMIDHILLQDLLSFELPILFVGDHGQLEPIGTNPKLMVKPEVRLEKIHRQAMDNPILRFATAVREGRRTPFWKSVDGRLNLTRASEFWKRIDPEMQMICGFNKTRHKVNEITRKILQLDKELVEIGDKLICLKNNKVHNIFNGQQVTVAGIGDDRGSVITLEVITDDDRSMFLPCWKPQFGQNAIADFNIPHIALMDYGYCLSAHKSQGSEWGSVLILEEIANVWDARRWRYTASTRAKEKLIYCF